MSSEPNGLACSDTWHVDRRVSLLLPGWLLTSDRGHCGKAPAWWKLVLGSVMCVTRRHLYGRASIDQDYDFKSPID
jgi:hypothetical protein